MPEPALLPPAGEGARRADEGALGEDRVVSEAHPIDLPMDVLFGKPPKMHRDARRPRHSRWTSLSTDTLDLHEAGLRVLAHPTVASKRSEEHTSELQSLMRISYAVFCLKTK